MPTFSRCCRRFSQAPALRRRNPIGWLHSSAPGLPIVRENSSIPFYGEPRPANDFPELSIFQRVGIAVHSATSALADPTKADAVAALGEVTGNVALKGVYDRMMNDPTGQRILKEKPVVDASSIDFDSLRRGSGSSQGTMTFGQAYASFMAHHGFDPEERFGVKYIEDPELAYVMLRYRQIHDFSHVLCNLPPTVMGKLALKWVELLQTNLPVAALSVTFGPLQLNSKERHLYDTVYKPWALRTGMNANFLMNVYFEEEFDQDLDMLRKRLGIEPAPTVDGISMKSNVDR